MRLRAEASVRVWDYGMTVILVDPPRWPAHGTTFGHLVTTTDLWDLHEFAERIGLSVWAFDHDHYDLPEAMLDQAVAAGAQLVSERDLVQALRASGLRVRHGARKPKLTNEALLRQWPLDPALGNDLLDRWNESHRRYHRASHLAELLVSLTKLSNDVPREVVLAAWFHDAVYEGTPGADEEASAELAERELAGRIPSVEVAEVARLVRSTTTHVTDPADRNAVLLCDGDLSILASSRGRYHVSLRDIRFEYGFLARQDFLDGRRAVVERFSGRDDIFTSSVARGLWEDAARSNLADELDKLSVGVWLPDPAARQLSEPH